VVAAWALCPAASSIAFAASSALANGPCNLARQVGGLDVSSRLLERETQPASAARIVARMEGDLRAIASLAATSAPPGPGSVQARMRDYIGSREALLKAYDDGGLAAAQDFLRVDRAAQSIRSIEAELECGASSVSAASDIHDRPAAELRLGQRAANGALSGGRMRSGARIAENWTVPLVAFPALALTILLLSRLLNRRQDPRHPCDVPAAVILREKMLDARIADISRGGAKLRVTNAACPGTRGRINLDSGEVLEFRVAWANAHFIGVSFLSPLEISPKRLLGL